tara:strand:+ start:96 stop:314 length:219 start_codon:yes stop_codon:yes gene_type:complete
MKLSTAINKAKQVYVQTNFGSYAASVKISKNVARTLTEEFKDVLPDDDGNYDHEWGSVAWYDEEFNALHIGN